MHHLRRLRQHEVGDLELGLSEQVAAGGDVLKHVHGGMMSAAGEGSGAASFHPVVEAGGRMACSYTTKTPIV